MMSAMLRAHLLCGAMMVWALGCGVSDEATPKAARAKSARPSALSCRPSEVSEQTFKVIKALEAPCAGCHNMGVRGYFKSAQAFQSLVVGDERMIKPGDPDGSEFIRLLEGTGTGAFKQMPIGLKSYAQMAQEDPSLMPMAELRAWVQSLDAQVKDVRPLRDAPRIRRLSAEQMRRALYQQLGLSDEDFYKSASNYQVELVAASSDNIYPVRSPETLPAPYSGYSDDRFFALGGGSAIDQLPSDESVSPTAVLTLTQVSQAWCRLALKKADNETLLGAGGQLSADAAQAKAMLSRWGLLFWGQRLASQKVDALYDEVFVPLSQEGVEPAYVGACSYFIRHPRWMYY